MGEKVAECPRRVQLVVRIGSKRWALEERGRNLKIIK